MRWLMRIVFILVSVVVLVAVGLLLLPGDKLGKILADQVRAQTGRELVLDGDVNISFWPVLGIETGPVTFANAQWAGPQPMLSAEGLAVGVEAAALLSGDVKIKRIVADAPVLRLEISDGRGNWEFGALTPPAGGAGGGQSGSAPAPTQDAQERSVTLDRLELTNARLVYVEDDETKLDFDAVDLTAKWPAADAPLDMTARLSPGEGPVDVAMTIPDFPAFAGGAATKLDMTMTAPGAEITFSGDATIGGQMSGDMRIVARDSARAFAALGQRDVGIPKGLGQAAEISARMTYTSDGRVSLRNLIAVLDQNRLTGEADLVIADPPQVTANLNAGDFDLSQIADTGAGSGGSGAAPAGGSDIGPGAAASQGWSTDPIDASALSLANGSIRLDADSIKTPDLTLGASRVTLELDRSRGVLRMHPVTLFSGALTGQVVANNRNGFSVGGNVKANGIEMQQALEALGGLKRLSGKASGNVEFLGSGQSEDQIMNSLSGKGRLDMGRGVISGLDLNRLMGDGKGQGGTTVFNSLSASFTMQGGNLTNNDLLMSLDNFRADGAGRIGLGAQDIDYLFTPVALRANSGKGIAVPVRIVGPWSNPAIKPDLTKALEAAAQGRLKELEGDAKQKLLDKAGQGLDTTVTDGAKIEDVLKNKLEDEAKKGLRKLFGGD